MALVGYQVCIGSLFNRKRNNRNPKILKLQNQQFKFKVNRPKYMGHHDLILVNCFSTSRLDINPHTKFQIAIIRGTLKSTSYKKLNLAQFVYV